MKRGIEVIARRLYAGKTGSKEGERENGEGRSRGVTGLEGSMRLKEVVHKE